MTRCEVVARYSDSAAAVTHALSLVATYMTRVGDHEGAAAPHAALAAAYAPLSVPPPAAAARRRPQATQVPPRGLLVFDIDDTLLFDAPAADGIVPHQDVVDLLRRAHHLGAEVHLVTARLNDDDMVAATRAELDGEPADGGLGLAGLYASLSLAPARARTSMASVSRWKMAQRRRIAQERGAAVTLTVGDQWGDMVVLADDEEIDELDDRFAAQTDPYIIVRPYDQVSLWGLKLPAYA